MITVPESFRRMPRWWSDTAGREWLDSLPERGTMVTLELPATVGRTP